MSFNRASFYGNQEMKKIKIGFGPPNCHDNTSSSKQFTFFEDAIELSKAILKAIYMEICLDLNSGVSIEKVSTVMGKVDAELNDDDLRIKIKYDALIQTLGQSMGNLREYGVLSYIYQKDHQLQFVVMNELDQLHHKYMTISKELDKQEAPLYCNLM